MTGMSEDLDVADLADVIDKAADLLWLHGRCIGTGKDPEGRLCVRGALALASGADLDDEDFVVYGDHGSVWRQADTVLSKWLAAHPELLPLRPYSDNDPEWLAKGLWPTWVFNDRLLPNAETDAFVVDTLRHAAKDARA